MFTLPALSYGYDALEPFIDAQTMEIHHTKHHQAYIDKLTAALQNHPELSTQPVEELLRTIAELPADIETAVRNHGGGHANHSLFWTVIGPQSQTEPTGALAEALNAAFGSFSAFQEKFTQAATTQFGSGWAWLVRTESGELSVYALPNQDSPFMQGDTPLLGLDVWEHAYYLKYQNKRPEYIAAFWNIVQWEAVERRFVAATE